MWPIRGRANKSIDAPKIPKVLMINDKILGVRPHAIPFLWKSVGDLLFVVVDPWSCFAPPPDATSWPCLCVSLSFAPIGLDWRLSLLRCEACWECK